MNPTTEQPPPPPPQLQPPRSSFSCDRHPTEQFTGFCPSCLCERLSTLELSSAASSSSRRPSNAAAPSSAAAAALKAIFRVPGSTISNDNKNSKNKPPTSSSSSSFFPELRRTKSFSASKNEGFSGVFEPQRHSCDVRGRNTLWSLFNLDDERKSSASKSDQQIEGENRRSVSSCVTGPVLESKEEEDDDQEDSEENADEYEEDDNGEIRVFEEPNVANVADETIGELVEEEPEDVKTMKDHIHLDSQAKKPSGMDLKEIAGSFWSAASVFSKKWQKWRRKQKVKKQKGATLPVEKPISRQYRETQSEIADYGFGRRSCDTDPRFSLDAARISFDAGRMSFDDVRPSFDEPRASWDGYLIGRSVPRLPPMLSVVEDSPAVHVERSDTQIPVEEDEKVPGGSIQTREYYSDSSSRRRKSLDRSNSIRKTAAAVVAEMDEMKTVSVPNAKVSPATIENRVSVDSNSFSHSNSLRDDCSETFELGFRDNASIIGNVERKGLKKSRRWKNIWGLIIRRSGGNKDEDEDERFNRGNGVERSLSESWQEFRREGNGEMRGMGFNRNVFRSNSSVSWRNSNNNGGSFGSTRKMSFETNGHVPNGNGRKKRDEFVLERNRSARYSPSHVDNGLLRFYLTPLRSSCRRGGLGVGVGGGSGKSKANNSHSIARSVLRLY